MPLARRLVNGRERGCLQVEPCIVRRLVNMSTRAMRLKTQARVLACLQVVFLRFQMSKNNPFLKAWLGLKRIVPIISEYTETRIRGTLNAAGKRPSDTSLTSVHYSGTGILV